MSEDRPIDKKAEVHFLVDNFGIAPKRAATVIETDEAAADELGSKVMAEDRQKDPLEGVPVPGGDKDPQHLEKGAEDLEKPVERRDSAPT